MSDDEELLEQPTQRRQSLKSNYECFGEHMENYNVEATALHRKLKSKMDALRILRQELEKFRTERDQFKLMAETLQLRYSAVKRSSLGSAELGKSSVAHLLHDTREKNIKLTTEVETLKQRLHELQGDIHLLRDKHQKPDKLQIKTSFNGESSEENYEKTIQWKQERANFIWLLENLKKKNAQLAFDFKTVIDEKEELITERDAYKCKAHRMNHELQLALKANESHPKFLDIDSILLENKYLHERLQILENELDLTKHSMNKYKSMLDAKRKKGIIKLGSSSNEESILSHKQVKSILESGIELPTKTETIQDLKSLCITLLDNLNDKTLALNHQKKANKMLGSKIAELEQRLQSMSGVELNNGYTPSQLLLNGYCPSLVDDAAQKLPTSNAASEENDDVEQSSEHLNSEAEEALKSSKVNSEDDGMSSLSTDESGRSILSSEYGIDVLERCNVIADLNVSDLLTAHHKTSSTTTDSGNCGLDTHISKRHLIISPEIAHQREKDLKDLPPELAQLVQKALQELDMRDFDERLPTQAE